MVSLTNPSREDLENGFFGDEADWMPEELRKFRPGKVFLLEQALGIEFDALDKKKIRFDNEDLDKMVQALIEKTDSREKYEDVLE